MGKTKKKRDTGAAREYAIQAYVSEEVYLKAQRAAQADDRTVSTWAARLIAKELARKP